MTTGRYGAVTAQVPKTPVSEPSLTFFPVMSR
jgi:hypothetical protein